MEQSQDLEARVDVLTKQVEYLHRELKAQRKVVQTQRVEITDQDGKARAGFTLEGDGAALSLWDMNEKCRVLLTSKAGPSLGLYDANGILRASLTTVNGWPVLGFLDETGKKLIASLGTYEGAGHVVINDPDGNTRVRISVVNNRPTVIINDEHGNSLFAAP